MSDAIFRVISSKGLHDMEYDHWETITFRQIVHLVTEWSEMYEHYQELQRKPQQPEVMKQLLEEAADILIVALDLAAIHKMDMSEVPLNGQPVGVLNYMYTGVPELIGKLGDRYRKRKVLDQEVLIRLIVLVSHIMRRHGADPINEIQKKMKINVDRPQRYGTTEAAT
jgi:NTP pyrophosphatase (non-canonical NTP hydrolase)